MLSIDTVLSKEYKKSLQDRGWDLSALDQIKTLSDKRKKVLLEVEQKKATRNSVSQEIASKKNENQDASQDILDMRKLSSDIKKMEEELSSVESRFNLQLSSLPNLCHTSVPIGKSEKDNRVERCVFEIKDFGFEPKDHVFLGKQLGIIDFEIAAKIAGARFVTLHGMGARLERALYNFMLDVQTKEHGYLETIPPYIVNSNALYGTGQFPKFVDDVFHLKDTDYHLIPTAEVPVTNYYSDKILSSADLPKSFVAFTPCFRSEAGSYGQDTKGLIRQHQFHKVELIKLTLPEDSFNELEVMTSHAEVILKKLKLPYRVVTLCSGDIGFSSAKTYDIEVWIPSENKYREISSISNCLDFQAKRANIRFRCKSKKPEFVHTLNGSGLAVGRALIAIIENYQREDGTISIPDVLSSYMDGAKIISKL